MDDECRVHVVQLPLAISGALKSEQHEIVPTKDATIGTSKPLKQTPPSIGSFSEQPPRNLYDVLRDVQKAPPGGPPPTRTVQQSQQGIDRPLTQSPIVVIERGVTRQILNERV
ncbi:hypothetical protein D3C71_1559210 [compost metagenome]